MTADRIRPGDIVHVLGREHECQVSSGRFASGCAWLLVFDAERDPGYPFRFEQWPTYLIRRKGEL